MQTLTTWVVFLKKNIFCYNSPPYFGITFIFKYSAIKFRIFIQSFTASAYTTEICSKAKFKLENNYAMDASPDYFVYTKTDENFIGIYRKQFDISELMHNQKTILISVEQGDK